MFASYRVLAFQPSQRWLNINCHLHNPIYPDTCGFSLPGVYHIQNGDKSVSYHQSRGLASFLARMSAWPFHLEQQSLRRNPEISPGIKRILPHHRDLHRSGDHARLAGIHLRGRRRACCSLSQPVPFHVWLFSLPFETIESFQKECGRGISHHADTSLACSDWRQRRRETPTPVTCSGIQASRLL